MSDSILSKIKNALSKLAVFSRNATSHANKPGFTKLNGSASLANGEWRDVIINGSSTLGANDCKTNFRGLIVANGSTNAVNSSFYSLEVNGTAHLEAVEVRNTLQVHGNAVIRGCTIDRLIIFGAKSQIEIIDSVVRSQQTLS